MWRLLMSEKKSSSGKESSIDVMPSVVTQKLRKNLIAPHPYMFTRGGVPEAYCPIVRCTPEEGMEKV
jgi:hypothetical protein